VKLTYLKKIKFLYKEMLNSLEILIRISHLIQTKALLFNNCTRHSTILLHILYGGVSMKFDSNRNSNTNFIPQVSGSQFGSEFRSKL